jgi:hypothetical protein
MKQKRERTPSLLDFRNDRKTEALEVTRISENKNSTKNESPGAGLTEENSPNAKPILGAIPSSNAMREQELDIRINTAVEQKFAEFLEKAGFSRKSSSKKGNKQTGYIRNEQWTDFLAFKERSDESFNETLKKILLFAKKYHELTEGSKP